MEVNTREHFTAHGLQRAPFAVESRWFRGACDITTYDLDELLGTKLRALYQRRKGRDLFDLSTALSQGGADPARIVAAFVRYMLEGGHRVQGAAFKENLAQKLEDPRFLSDIPPLLSEGRDWDARQGAGLVLEKLCPLLEGEL